MSSPGGDNTEVSLKRSEIGNSALAYLTAGIAFSAGTICFESKTIW